MRLLALLAFGTCLLGPILLCAAHGDQSVEVETALIRGATFTMGTPVKDKSDPEYHEDEAPLKVTVKNFRIGKYPITAEQMCVFLNSPEAKTEDREALYNHKNIGAYTYSTIELTDDGLYVPRRGAAKAPANQVTWKGAALFCKWLSQKTGEKHRLPTEAEWELAARGRELRQWPWGNEAPIAKHGPRYDPEELLNSKDLADRVKTGRPTWPTTPVGSHPANATPEGVHDLLAYVIGEWCANRYVARPGPEQVVNPDMDWDDLATDRVVRGYFHRPHSRGPSLPLAEWPQHGGQTWTRVHGHPMDAAKQAARYGFRVVREAAD